MLFIPAMDIRDGKIAMGPRHSREVYPSLPDEVASSWSSLSVRDIEGREKRVEEMQVFDINRRHDTGENTTTIRQLKCCAPAVVMNMGGGIRTMDTAIVCATIADRVIVGGYPVRDDPGFLRAVEREMGRDRVVFAVDFRGDDRQFGSLCDYCKRHGEHARYILLTARKHEGLMTGPDLELYERVCLEMEGTGADIIAAGGIRNRDDLTGLKDTGVYGAVAGRALYGGSLTIQDALMMV